MASENELTSSGLVRPAVRTSTHWLFSWPLLTGAFAYLYAIYHGNTLLLDGDTYSHIATGQWILHHRSIPTVDPFSHTMPGADWTAHEWLSEVILATAHDWGGWMLVIAVTGIAFALTVGLLTRALLRWLEPIYALLFGLLGLAMTSDHLLARPHILAMPLLMLWTIELVRASEERRAPGWWLLAVMAVWANLHGGFTLGIALTGAVALEAVLDAHPERRLATIKAWGFFLALAVVSSLVTPHGVQGIVFTWHVLFNLGFVLERVGEWRSPSFHAFSTFELWLLGGIALVLHQGLRLPPIRLILLLGLLHLALKHVRYIELVGLLAPIFIAGPFGAQWAARSKAQANKQVQGLDRFFKRMTAPATSAALLASCAALVAATALNARIRPLQLPETAVPQGAVDAVQKAGIKGPVLNSYSMGGYLIYRGIPVFIDGRADMFGEQFVKDYLFALDLRTPNGLEKLMDRYGVTWTILEAESAPIALLDRLPTWRRLHTDKKTVVHVKTSAAPAPLTAAPGKENRP